MRAPPVLLLALAACAGDRTPGGAANGADGGSGRPGPVATFLYVGADGCRAAGAGTLRCEGPGGWAIQVSHAGGRAVLTLVGPGGEHPVDVAAATGHAGESRIGDRAEWWTEGSGRRNTPVALVVTHVAVRPDGPRNSAGERLDLLVVKLGDEVCITDRVPAAPGARAEARILARDAASRPCAGGGEATGP
jgi:hypothetical protein